MFALYIWPDMICKQQWSTNKWLSFKCCPASLRLLLLRNGVVKMVFTRCNLFFKRGCSAQAGRQWIVWTVVCTTWRGTLRLYGIMIHIAVFINVISCYFYAFFLHLLLEYSLVSHVNLSWEWEKRCITAIKYTGVITLNKDIQIFELFMVCPSV